MRAPAGARVDRSAASAVEAAYRTLAPVYDLVYGLGLEHGRRQAMRRLAPGVGERILEVGVGTGLSAVWYPSSCRVTAIDLSAAMLARARARLARRAIAHVSLALMDAAHLALPDGYFDAVYAPYVINVVADPLPVAAEMQRVCRRGGRMLFLNHFTSVTDPPGPASRFLDRLARRVGNVDMRLGLEAFLRESGLTAESVEDVNFRASTLVVCRKP